MEVQEKPRSPKLHEALASNPELIKQFDEIWKAMPTEYQLTAINIYSGDIFSRLTCDLKYKILECATGWLEMQLENYEATKEQKRQLHFLQDAKNVLRIARRHLKDLKRGKNVG